MTTLPKINPKHEVEKIVDFLKTIQKKTRINKVVIGLSGGVDSTTVYYLLKKAYKPENIIGVGLSYNSIKSIVNEFEARIPNFFHFWGRGPTVTKNFGIEPHKLVRRGNIIARVRMIILFDLAKKHNALVCGTENKSEKLLGYFTRFGDAASDIEPITHLYKTQVYQLAEYLKVSKKIIKAKPTAGLWKGQTDEDELGFTYKEADQILHLYFDKKMPTKEIKKSGYKNVEKIIKRFLENKFKQETPYSL
ncbi:MAG: NAD(+) synthase [Candidatus Roizmanbacteria bacterium]